MSFNQPTAVDFEAALERVRALTPEARASVEAALRLSPERAMWSPLPGPQTEAYNSNADELFFGGGAGGGKFGCVAGGYNAEKLGYALASDPSAEARFMQDVHHVQTPFGAKLIDDIVVGDSVLNPDGTTIQVIAATPVHTRPSFRVRFNDNTSMVVGDRHIWPVKVSGKRPRSKATANDAFDLSGLDSSARFNAHLMRQYRLVTTRQLAAMTERAQNALVNGGRPFHPLVPLTEPVNTQASFGRTHMLPAYTLGVLLGDGSLSANTPMWTKPSPDVAFHVQEDLLQNALIGNPSFLNRDRVNHHADGKGHSLVGGDTYDALRSLGLVGKRSWEKFIPTQYLRGPLELRKNLLQGLMDTDGFVDARGQCYWSTSSPQLQQDFLYLARSLGYYACPTVKEEPRYSYKGEERIGRPSYQVYLTGRNRTDLVRAQAKAYRATDPNNEGGKRVVSVEPVGDIEGRCIQVSHPNGLYLANDFTVTHNSALIAGLALTKHVRTLIIRRESTQLRGLVDEVARILRTRDGLNRQAGQWRIPPNLALFPDQLVELGGVPNPGDEENHQGIPHDLLAFDEATQLSEYVINYLTTWNRSDDPSRRCRIVLASNPPTPSTAYRGKSSGGAWIIRRYAPWLDPNYSDPHGKGKALPGELRYFVTLNGIEREWPDPLPFIHFDPKSKREEIITPKSRTFIPALANQNPYTGAAYIATLQKLPEPLRSALLYGDFSVTLSDQPMQAFPAEWVRAAMKRHSDGPRKGYPGYPPEDQAREMTALGCDIARGGIDSTVLCPRYSQWFAPFIVIPRDDSADGPSAAAQIVRYRRNTAVVVIDANGVGASAYDHLRTTNPDDVNIVASVGSEGTVAKDKSGRLGFVNRRSELYWKLREALDPGSPYSLALPQDDELFEELTTLTWSEQNGKVKIMTKEEHIKILGHSPDKSDSLTLAWSVRDENDTAFRDARTAREERLSDARGTGEYESRYPGSGRSRISWTRKARWGDRVLPYPDRY